MAPHAYGGTVITVPKLAQIDVAFPTIKSISFCPAYSNIPVEFRSGETNRWCKFFTACFYFGKHLDTARLGLMPKEGVVAADAWQALQAVMGCYGLKHEHKTAAFAFLCSEWFLDVRWERKDTGEVVPFENDELERAWLQKNSGL